MDNQYLSDLRKTVKELNVVLEELYELQTEAWQDPQEIEDQIRTMEHRRDYYQSIFRAELSRRIHTAIDSYRTDNGQRKSVLRLVK